jgi:hypothetical protein
MRFADSPGDQLRDLGAKVEDEDFGVVHGVVEKMASCTSITISAVLNSFLHDGLLSSKSKEECAISMGLLKQKWLKKPMEYAQITYSAR